MNQNLIPFLIKDVEPGSDSPGLDLLGTINGNLIFSTFNPPVNGLNTKLWKSDGSEAGTSIVRDFGGSSFPPSSTIKVDDVLYFTMNTSFQNISLFRSDGTESGTFALVSLDPRSPANIGGLTAAGNTVYYTGFDSSDSFQSKLFKIDNNTNNPVQVQQNVTAGGANPSN
ncbi:MAG: hypothetical protein AAF915_22010 [Cyanobacteria bacterium P01_D01_bin.50]